VASVPAVTTRQPDMESRPNPDPTVLTTEQLHREMTSQRDLFDEKIRGIVAEFTEKLQGIATQFIERDTRADLLAKATSEAAEKLAAAAEKALAAALQAAKEAVGEQNTSVNLAFAKSEANFIKQMDQLGELMRTMNQSITDKVDDMNLRFSKTEGHSSGTKDLSGWIFGGIGMITAIIVAAVALIKG
jgi:hypothetical protein